MKNLEQSRASKLHKRTLKSFTKKGIYFLLQHQEWCNQFTVVAPTISLTAARVVSPKMAGHILLKY